MPNLDNNSINPAKSPEISTLVMLNGIYKPELFDKYNNPLLYQQALEIPANTKTTKLIHLLLLTTEDCQTTINVDAAKNSSVILIVEYQGLENNVCTNNTIVNITAEKNSEIIYYELQTKNIAVTYQTQTNIKQKQNSKITHYFIGAETKTANNTVYIELTEKQASYHARGIIALSEKQVLDYQTKIDHLAPNCTSNVLFKGIMNNQAKGNFNCLVVAHPKAKHTETHVTNKNLLLSESALMNTAPQLEVYTDDVICTHGATVGQLDQNAIFYFRSRGLTEKQTIQLLTTAFVNEITEQLPSYCQSKINLGTLL